MKNVVTLMLVFLSVGSVYGQKDPASTYPVSKYEPLTLKISEDGSKYIRFIVWHQQWLQTSNLADDKKTQITSLARRSRFLAMAQVSPRFLIVSHWGLNNLTKDNMSSLGNNGDGPQLFLHDAWTEFKLSGNSDVLYVGGGLHYWKGLTRLSSQSTLNFMTLDNPRPFVHWHSLGITDQFARHLGTYFKGQIGKFDYRLAINNPLTPANALGGGKDFGGKSDLQYVGSATVDGHGDPVGNTIVEGYFRCQVFDTESNKLPYIVGTYMGGKKILAIGAGFFAHPNAMYNTVTLEHSNVTHIAGDVYLDMPLGAKGNAVNTYASFINFNYGENYMSRWAGTGTNFYSHFGYFLKSLSIMPYVAYQTGSYDAYADKLYAFDAGVNYYVLGHNAKVTMEYHAVYNNPLEGGVDSNGNAQDVKQIRLQLHIFL